MYFHLILFQSTSLLSSKIWNVIHFLEIFTQNLEYILIECSITDKELPVGQSQSQSERAAVHSQQTVLDRQSQLGHGTSQSSAGKHFISTLL